MKTVLDHIVIGAADLQKGVEYVEKHLGITVPFGGSHPVMATHNCLTRLSDTTFLEILAIDKEARQPLQPRWFGLDDPAVQKKLEHGPELLTWVVNCDDITAALSNAEIGFGKPQPLSRGDLRWYFGVPDDGRLIAGGILPYIISWQTEPHPAASMTHLGCRLENITIFTPFYDWTMRQLEAIGALGQARVDNCPPARAPYLEVEFTTPGGKKVLLVTS
ncbi:MAG: VOC family protein [Desulfopila sp.]